MRPLQRSWAPGPWLRQSNKRLLKSGILCIYVVGISGRKFVKRKLSDISESQRCESSDESYSRSGSGDSDTYPNRDTMTVKTEYGDDLIAFHIPASTATLTALKKETWEGFELNNVSYELAYLDNVNGFILLDSDEELM
ncbi:hypothetical protein Tco_0107372, partial [Tanacetum coccineum]